MEKTRIWNTIGMILGIALIILGIVFCATPSNSFGTEYPEYASFGADFYTYQYDATRIAANNTADTANNIEAIGEKLALYAGFAFIAAGIIVFIHYAKLNAILPKPEKAEAAPLPEGIAEAIINAPEAPAEE